MANALDPSQMTLGEAVIRYRLTGEPFPPHLTSGMTPIKGTDKPRKDSLAGKLQWGRPWYRLGGKGHDGNGNPMHGRAPGQILANFLDGVTKDEINSQGGN